MWVGLGIMTTGCPNFWSFTKYKNHTTNDYNEKRKVNLEEDPLAGGTEDWIVLG